MFGHIASYDKNTGVGYVRHVSGDAIFVVDPSISRNWQVGDRVQYLEDVRAINLTLDATVIEAEGRIK